jgi:hypothetical protein
MRAEHYCALHLSFYRRDRRYNHRDRAVRSLSTWLKQSGSQATWGCNVTSSSPQCADERPLLGEGGDDAAMQPFQTPVFRRRAHRAYLAGATWTRAIFSYSGLFEDERNFDPKRKPRAPGTQALPRTKKSKMDWRIPDEAPNRPNCPRTFAGRRRHSRFGPPRRLVIVY